ncbi:MAG: STAS domain-containing protein [Sedimenticolaceae bacterium]
MSITTSLSDDGNAVTIHVQGRFDYSTHQAFDRAFKEHPRDERYFVVDFKYADYMDNSAMGIPLQLRDYGATGRAIELVDGGVDMLEILRTANFDKIFQVS